MIHEMKLQSGPFEKIRCGEKTIELRLLDEKRQLLRVGDTIEFVRTDDPACRLRTRVKALHPFPDFRALYDSLDMLRCGYAPGETADPADMEQYYPIGRQKQYGVVGIELEIL